MCAMGTVGAPDNPDTPMDYRYSPACELTRPLIAEILVSPGADAANELHGRQAVVGHQHTAAHRRDRAPFTIAALLIDSQPRRLPLGFPFTRKLCTLVTRCKGSATARCPDKGLQELPPSSPSLSPPSPPHLPAHTNTPLRVPHGPRVGLPWHSMQHCHVLDAIQLHLTHSPL